MALSKWPKVNEQVYVLIEKEVHRCLFKGRNLNAEGVHLVQLLPSNEEIECYSSNLYSTVKEAEEASWGFVSTKKVPPTFRSNPDRKFTPYSGCERCRRVLRPGEKCDCTVGIKA